VLQENAVAVRRNVVTHVGSRSRVVSTVRFNGSLVPPRGGTRWNLGGGKESWGWEGRSLGILSDTGFGFSGGGDEEEELFGGGGGRVIRIQWVRGRSEIELTR
jgi:hypothetical protein